MREIKFRQPISVNGEFHSWHYWGFIEDSFIGAIHDKGKVLAGDSYQYTGLKDSKGVEIYEGDVLEYWPAREHRSVIEWKDGAFGFGDCLAGYQMSEVIGNIYENPELLK